MSAEIVNLKQYRKKKQRVEKERAAGDNRVKYGRTKRQKQRDEFESGRYEADLTGKHLDDDEPS